MTHSAQFRKMLAASAVAAMTGLAMFAQTGRASASNVLYCEGASRQSVIECCEHIVQKKGLPLWMKQTGRNCQARAVVKCAGCSHLSAVAAANPRRCRLVAVFLDESHDRQKTERGSQRGSGRGQK